MIEGGSPGDSLCIIETTDLDSIEHGSREPMQPFESPFLGMTDDQVRAWLKAHRRPDFGSSRLLSLMRIQLRTRPAGSVAHMMRLWMLTRC
jgi:hypothetical protein